MNSLEDREASYKADIEDSLRRHGKRPSADTIKNILNDLEVCKPLMLAELSALNPSMKGEDNDAMIARLMPQADAMLVRLKAIFEKAVAEMYPS